METQPNNIDRLFKIPAVDLALSISLRLKTAFGSDSNQLDPIDSYFKNSNRPTETEMLDSLGRKINSQGISQTSFEILSPILHQSLVLLSEQSNLTSEQGITAARLGLILNDVNKKLHIQIANDAIALATRGMSNY